MGAQFGKTPVASALDSLLAPINNAGNGYVEIRSGTIPANLAAAATGTLLSRCDLVTYPTAAFGNTSTTTLIATGNTSGGVFAADASINATGTAGYFRMFSDAGVAIFQGTITTTGGGGELELNSLSLVIGGTLTITSWTLEAIGWT